MKYEIMMSCGHEDTVELFGKEKERDRKIEYFKIHGLCKECYRKKKEEETQKEGRIYAVFIEENGFDSIFFDADV